MLRETFPAPIVARGDDNNGTIRFDMKFPMVTPLGDPREVWFDHVIVQETCPTYASATRSFVEEKLIVVSKITSVINLLAVTELLPMC